MRHILILLLLAVIACGGVATPATTPPDDAMISAGAGYFQTYCAACHGVDLRGTTLGPSFLSIVYEPNHHGDFAFVSAAQNGVPAHHWSFGDMPPVPGISDDEITAVIKYVRNVQQTEGFEE